MLFLEWASSFWPWVLGGYAGAFALFVWFAVRDELSYARADDGGDDLAGTAVDRDRDGDSPAFRPVHSGYCTGPIRGNHGRHCADRSPAVGVGVLDAEEALK